VDVHLPGGDDHRLDVGGVELDVGGAVERIGHPVLVVVGYPEHLL